MEGGVFIVTKNNGSNVHEVPEKSAQKGNKATNENKLSHFEKLVNSFALKLVSKGKRQRIYEKTAFYFLRFASGGWYKRKEKSELNKKRKEIIKRYLKRCDSLMKKVAFIMSVIAKPAKKIVAAGVVLCSALIMINTASYDVVLGVYAGGELVGYLDSKSVMTTAINSVELDMRKTSDTNYTLNPDIDYVFVNVKSPVLLNDADCYRIAYNIASSDFVDAYALYVDDKFVAACTEFSAVNQIIADLKLPGESNASGTVKNEVKHYYQKCLKSTVVEPDKLAELLGASLYGEDFASENTVDLTMDKDKNANENNNAEVLIIEDTDIPRFAIGNTAGPIPNKLSDGTKITTDRNELLVELNLVYERFETKTETIGYETTYIESDDYYIGTQMLKSSGRDGSAEVTYKIEYDKNGEISRAAVSRTVISEPVSEVMVIGTSPAPTVHSSGTLIWPTDVPKGVSSYYGGRELFGNYDFHLGIDILNDYGNDIWAADSGVVTFAGYHYSYGYYVTIEHENGMITRYAHMSRIYTEEGMEVKQGEVIGAIGKTGVATAYHLHFEVRIDDKTVDPLNYLPEL